MLDAVLDELERLLADERDAIRSLDGERVLRFARRKQELVHGLHARRAELGEAGSRRFRSVAQGIRHNGILLAHARNVLRDAVAIVAGRTTPVSLHPSRQPEPGRALSVRG
jgi:hypothetical protein